MSKSRLDVEITRRGLVTTRSQAESFIKLGKVTVNDQVVQKPGYFVSATDTISITAGEQYVSRAGLKLASVAGLLKLDFRDKVVLDVGSSTGGFTDYALRSGAKKVYAVDVGTDQLHPSLRDNPQIELHEKTDIRDFYIDGNKRMASGGAAPKNVFAEQKILGADQTTGPASSDLRASKASDDGSGLLPDIVVIDVSFISLREILPHIARELMKDSTIIAAMVKPQFEAGRDQVNKGVIKNDAVRRQILKDFEVWSKEFFVILDKRDSDVAGAKGNQERFYLLTLNRNSTISPGRIT